MYRVGRLKVRDVKKTFFQYIGNTFNTLTLLTSAVP